MPRKARKKSSTGIYHCIIRGIDKQDIFLDNQDRYKFLKEIENTKEIFKYELYAYCLMDNHVHMLIKETDNKLCKIMHNLVLRYSVYYNKKYERVGHVFQNRYLSKPVETEGYLLILQRYIHQNPRHMESYKWSSYQEYIKNEKLINRKFILALFDEIEEKAIDEFKKFTCSRVYKKSIMDYKDSEMVRSISDNDVINIIKDSLNIKNILSIKKYNVKIRNEYLKKILQIEGITTNQLSRIMQVDKKTLIQLKKEIERPVPNGGKNHHRETSLKEENNG